MRLTKEEISDIEREGHMNNARIKKDMKTAKRDDFSIVNLDGDFAYAVALYGCFDIAKFRRKSDAERFINSFAERATVKEE